MKTKLLVIITALLVNMCFAQEKDEKLKTIEKKLDEALKELKDYKKEEPKFAADKVYGSIILQGKNLDLYKKKNPSDTTGKPAMEKIQITVDDSLAIKKMKDLNVKIPENLMNIHVTIDSIYIKVQKNMVVTTITYYKMNDKKQQSLSIEHYDFYTINDPDKYVKLRTEMYIKLSDLLLYIPKNEDDNAKSGEFIISDKTEKSKSITIAKN